LSIVASCKTSNFSSFSLANFVFIINFFNYLFKKINNMTFLLLQAVIDACFERLLENVDHSLSNKNRETFTNNLAYFRRDVTSTTGVRPATATEQALMN
jgi:hypothetical protein